MSIMVVVMTPQCAVAVMASSTSQVLEATAPQQYVRRHGASARSWQRRPADPRAADERSSQPARSGVGRRRVGPPPQLRRAGQGAPEPRAADPDRRPPRRAETPLDGDALLTVRRSLQALLDAHEPNPAVAIDRCWTVQLWNEAAVWLGDGRRPEARGDPSNNFRISRHPDRF